MGDGGDLVGFLMAAAGVVLSLLFLYVPGLRKLFDGLDENGRRLWMLVILVVLTGALYALSCAGVAGDLLGITVACDQQGLIGLLRAFGLAVIGNQTAHRIAPRPSR